MDKELAEEILEDVVENNKAIRKNDDGSTTVTLKKPIVDMDKEIVEVTLRDIYAKDLRVMDQVSGEIGKRLRLIARLSNLDIKAVDKIHISDITVLTEVLDNYLEKSH